MTKAKLTVKIPNTSEVPGRTQPVPIYSVSHVAGTLNRMYDPRKIKMRESKSLPCKLKGPFETSEARIANIDMDDRAQGVQHRNNRDSAQEHLP